MHIEIAIHADLLCPWSFLEKRSLETAMYRYKTRNPNVEFEVIWKPYLLYPTLRKVDKRELYTRIMSPEKLRDFIDNVQKAGNRHGIEFAVHGSTGGSQNCHRLIALTLRTLGPVAQAAVVESLFRGHFENGLDVTDNSWLLSVGRSVGLEPKAMIDVFQCEIIGRMLEEEVLAAAAGGVMAVPSVLVGGKFRVGGYQEPKMFEDLFDRLQDESEGSLPPMSEVVRLANLDREGFGQSREGLGPDRGDPELNNRGGLGLYRQDPGPVRQWPGPDRGVMEPNIGGPGLDGSFPGPARQWPGPARQGPGP
ncbi:hypothetical protein G7Z17_g8751 [Cylindrodendrum hubeiense]|uniref:DSBA-like thioredoxin domain-containing protein n=1 Tax=Cylindrodendrum hubeiense TaxID=595255 RepID=A0A9P5L689_9HYPO|nr:hypothetical protein G7Z17_g8751 [Cylindrodendrum hubeiense]